MPPNRSIDHIVYAVPDLEVAINDLENRLGVRPTFGGYHLTQGTKNALLNLGNQCYLELLAVDQENKDVTAPRWMGIDLIEQPRITRWALKSTELERDARILNNYDRHLGKIHSGQRKRSDGELLRWRMTLPTASPVVDLLPFMTDWQNSEAHPTDQLAEDCTLVSILFTHPQPNHILPIFEQLGINLDITQGSDIRIQIKVRGPKGIVII